MFFLRIWVTLQNAFNRGSAVRGDWARAAAIGRRYPCRRKGGSARHVAGGASAASMYSGKSCCILGRSTGARLGQTSKRRKGCRPRVATHRRKPGSARTRPLAFRCVCEKQDYAFPLCQFWTRLRSQMAETLGSATRCCSYAECSPTACSGPKGAAADSRMRFRPNFLKKSANFLAAECLFQGTHSRLIFGCV